MIKLLKGITCIFVGHRLNENRFETVFEPALQGYFQDLQEYRIFKCDHCLKRLKTIRVNNY